MQATPTYKELRDILEYLAPTHYLNWVTFTKDTLRSRFGWHGNPPPNEILSTLQAIVQRVMPYAQFVQMAGDLFPDSVYTHALQTLLKEENFTTEIVWQESDRARWLRNEFILSHSTRDFLNALQNRYKDFQLTAMTSEKARQCAVVFEKRILKHENSEGAEHFWTWKMGIQMEFDSERYTVEEEVSIGQAALRLVARYYFYTEKGVLKTHLAFESEFNNNYPKPTLQEKEYVWQPVGEYWVEEKS